MNRTHVASRDVRYSAMMEWFPTEYFDISSTSGADILPGAIWYESPTRGSRVRDRIDVGSLSFNHWLTADFFLDGDTITQFVLALAAEPDGEAFQLTFSIYPRVQSRVRLNLQELRLNAWLLPREAGFLKPMCGGVLIAPQTIGHIRLAVVSQKPDAAIKWCMTPWRASLEAPAMLQDPLIPDAPLIDEVGQATFRDWPGKTRGPEANTSTGSAAQVVALLTQQHERATLPIELSPGRSRWGGLVEDEKDEKPAATGFFTKHHDGKRWWLIDPDGHPFFSAGPCCVTPGDNARITGLRKALEWIPDQKGEFADAISNDSVHFTIANFIRAFGPKNWRDHWQRIAVSELKQLGFNTIANWSDLTIGPKFAFPFVMPMHGMPGDELPMLFRDFPDVFDPRFEMLTSEWAKQLAPTRNEPALIGYFLMNEPTWGFAEQTIAAGMLYNTDHAHSRDELAKWATQKYPTDDALAIAWDMPGLTRGKLASGRWSAATMRLSDKARAQLADFSGVLCRRYFTTASNACRAVDPNHLNMGARYHTLPPKWAREGMETFDVFSINSYSNGPKANAEEASIATGLPVLVGEFHFGSPDVGLPSAALVTVATQEDRANAFRNYVEQHAAKPWCIGVHWFTMYDQNALGRFDGEAYNSGFFDVCNRPYELMSEAAQATHGRMYDVARGLIRPCALDVKFVERLSV